jgi:hypothetical protein
MTSITREVRCDFKSMSKIMDAGLHRKENGESTLTSVENRPEWRVESETPTGLISALVGGLPIVAEFSTLD